MEIRQAKSQDHKAIMRLINQAKAYFKAASIDQWQDGYPNEEGIRNDISLGHSYVLIDHDQVIGTFYFAIENEPDYALIRNGHWLTSSPYAVVHRVVVDSKYKGMGLAKLMLDYAITISQAHNIGSIRMDTHKDNLSMQRFLTKNGFTFCGDITLLRGGHRIAFEKIL